MTEKKEGFFYLKFVFSGKDFEGQTASVRKWRQDTCLLVGLLPLGRPHIQHHHSRLPTDALDFTAARLEFTRSFVYPCNLDGRFYLGYPPVTLRVIFDVFNANVRLCATDSYFHLYWHRTVVYRWHSISSALGFKRAFL